MSRTPNSPSRILWLIAIIAGLLGILGRFVAIDTISGYSFELVAIGFVLLFLGTTFRGM